MKTKVVSLVSAVALTIGLAWPAGAESVTYFIDSSQSSLTISGHAFGLASTAQKPGSLVDAFTGTITGDLSGGVLTFSGGSEITALLNPAGPFTTADNLFDGPGNYGVQADGFVTGYGLANMRGIYRDLKFDITTGTAQNGSAPNGQNIILTEGHLDYTIVLNGTLFEGKSSSLVGRGGANTSDSLVTLTPTTLRLPVQITTGDYSNRRENYEGWIVAVIPEPGVLSLGLFGMAAILIARARRHG